MTAEEWIAYLQLEPHPEGGYFRRSYTAELTLALPDRAGPRPVATAIYYLLKSGQRSRLHRLKSDELWHFYTGSPLTVHVLDSEGRYVARRLGADPTADQRFQLAIHAGCWFGATVDDPAGFSLVGCTVAPGFDFADFELANRSALVRQYPHHIGIIEQFT
ncbi:MAG: cupin domain-containing protein [Candidatus Competibacter sp.]